MKENFGVISINDLNESLPLVHVQVAFDQYVDISPDLLGLEGRLITSQYDLESNK